jgi:hypothetical protein
MVRELLIERVNRKKRDRKREGGKEEERERESHGNYND